jgi:hypothetical protein
LALWLRDTRKRHVTPKGRPWAQEYAVDRINEWAAATGQTRENGEPWRLHRPNYVGYEGGKNAEPETVARLVAFWVAQGEPAPDLTPIAPPELEPAPDLASVLSRLNAELTAMREERAEVRAEAAILRRQRAAWEKGVVAVLQSFAAGQVPAELLDALAPLPLEASPR